MLPLHCGQNFLGMPLPVQGKFMTCFFPHFGQMHSTLILSKLMISSSSLSLFKSESGIALILTPMTLLLVCILPLSFPTRNGGHYAG